ncbi:hypothetical protein IE81DRAFT_59309 [Ceraceosorus guamensis]|uniref:C2H2-type domain-containing protein n=1 Tax=Ceraceosorus guamensis TaxID=1522189 RepID=A0A316W1Y5_9BASI|nr:hypothetical protein IE81DRAFT_59309 [Ceraceosorus guamensis]PWN43800.1 hypothetical protein IE81DRAFT_59309 [Ceraceosorus guamensis]
MLCSISIHKANRGERMPSSSSQHPQRHVCDQPGCTKSYARPDHLLRHQLNHEAGASTVLRCDQCERTFVRPDLLTRHLERHALRGKNLGRWSNHTKAPKKTKTDSTGFDHDAQSEDMFKRPRRNQDVEGPMRERYYGRPQSTLEPLHTPAQHSSQSPLMSDQQGMHGRNALLWTSSSPPTRNVDAPIFLSNGEPASIEAWRATTAAAGSISPTMARDGLPLSEDAYSAAGATNSHFGSPSATQNVLLGMHAKGPTGPDAFPFAAPPPDLSAHFNWLLDGSDPAMCLQMLLTPEDRHLDFSPQSSHQASPSGGNTLHLNVGQQAAGAASSPLSRGPIASAEDGLDGANGHPSLEELTWYASIEAAVPDTPLTHVSEHKRAELLQFLAKSYELPTSPLFSCAFLRYYVHLFFQKYHPQSPVIHKATFVADRADPLLLAPLIVIGAHFGESRCHEFAVRVGAKLWGSFVSIDDFRPARATLQMLQGMVLTQAFCKMMASRPQHETSHLFSSFVVTLARRNACFFDTSHHGRYDTFDIETRWQMWSKDEMKKRISFMCFVLDARGALLFRHIPAMSCPQIHLHLPSPQDEFEAPSAQEWIALREARGAQSEMHFIMAIKAAMNGQPPANGDVWTHYILLHGLLSIAYDLRWKQNALLGNANTDWRQRVVRALDLWKVSLDIACCKKAEDLSTQVIYRKSCSLAVWSKIALYCDWIEIQIYAGLPSVLGRFIDRATFTTARNNVRSWANCSEGRQATWHSARFLASVLLGDGSTSFLISESEAAKNAMRSAAKDLPLWKLKGVHAQMSAQKSNDAAPTYELVHHPWVLYLCSLVLWAYGQALAPPQENGPERA